MIGALIAGWTVLGGCVTRKPQRTMQEQRPAAVAQPVRGAKHVGEAQVEASDSGPPIAFPIVPRLASVTIEKVTVRERIVLENVLFELDKADLRPEGKATIEEAAAYLKQYPNDRAIVEGHACAMGSEEHNLALGMRRAEAVRNHLVALGIASERIRTISYGESQPVADNTTEEGRALNRRAVILIEEER